MGEIDDSLYIEQEIKFDVDVPTFFNIALILRGMMVGFGLLAIASWRGCRQRGLRKSLRVQDQCCPTDADPILLGLGGWFLALLIVMIVWPSLFVGSQLLAVVSMGTAIGLGIYLAWVSRETRFLGLVVGVAGALIGAWLGFNSASGFAAIPTTIVGAAITANLALIVVDIVWDRAGHRQSRAA